MGGRRDRRRRGVPRTRGGNGAPAPVSFDLGLVRQDLRDYEKAAAAYRKALDKKPDYAEAALNLGIVLQEAGDLDSAMRAYREAYRLRPQAFGKMAMALTSASTAGCGSTKQRCAARSAVRFSLATNAKRLPALKCFQTSRAGLTARGPPSSLSPTSDMSLHRLDDAMCQQRTSYAAQSRGAPIAITGRQSL